MADGEGTHASENLKNFFHCFVTNVLNLEREHPGLAEVGHDTDRDGEEPGGVVGEPLKANLVLKRYLLEERENEMRTTWVETDSLIQPRSSCSSPRALKTHFGYLNDLYNYIESPFEDGLTGALLASVCLTELD